MTDDEIIAVVKAHKEGKAIQFRLHGSREAWRVAHFPTWSFEGVEYRVKPEPLVCWVVRYDDGSIGYPVFATEKHAQDVAISNQGVAVKMVEADEND